jgi:hypothetical protein
MKGRQQEKMHLKQQPFTRNAPTATFTSARIFGTTTIINNNASLWAALQPEGALLDWLRNMAAHRLARSGAEWMRTFGRFNSGTYYHHRRAASRVWRAVGSRC